MCGVGGIISNKLKSQQFEEQLGVMADVMKFRGPDAQNTEILKSAGFVHTRLKIVDLNDHANQPMYSKDGQYLMVFNGEIYNYKELKQRYGLSDLKTTSDTEVLLEGIVKLGLEAVVKDCVGMFAIALYKLSTGEIQFARDRFGQKPLYYCINDNGLYFCSDLRGISRNVKDLSVDFFSLDYYLTELAMPQPSTIFQQVKQLKPGCIGVFDGKNMQEKSYFTAVNVGFDQSLTESVWLNKIEDQLLESTRIRSFSDVDMGYFLSGGVDSGLIVSLMASNSDRKIDTYTVGYENTKFDESGYAKKLADKYGTNHSLIKIDNKGLKDEIENLVSECGEPFADSSLVPSYYVTKAMRKHVTVAISGDGGDEMFGYPEYERILKLQEFNKKSKWSKELSSLKAKVVNRLSPGANLQEANYLFTTKNIEEGQLLNRAMCFCESDKLQLYIDAELKKERAMENYHLQVWKNIEDENWYTKKWIGGFNTRLLNDYLVKVDRSSMYNSLEVRSPFLDHRIAELVSKIPPTLKYKNGEAKYLLKKLAEKWIDPEISSRSKKGFAAPIHEWLKNELQDVVYHYLSKDKVEKRGWFNSDYVEELISDHMKNKNDHSYKIWALLCLEIWMVKNCDD